ncbi:Uncharacterized protein FWK35_00028332 [Aphis craccivora]|uniref:Uncharacterized protein n=1 Tax=Aphis craccivora TaxID=307492 RepID=A0A6G0XZL5_APHCR|nr:Uncharacterized protein FWK35_00028332 [Aphis craccivora]
MWHGSNNTERGRRPKNKLPPSNTAWKDRHNEPPADNQSTAAGNDQHPCPQHRGTGGGNTNRNSRGHGATRPPASNPVDMEISPEEEEELLRDIDAGPPDDVDMETVYINTPPEPTTLPQQE